MRGERALKLGSSQPHIGSSPHARGTLGDSDRSHGCYRFIPACAGNACSVNVSLSKATVHPRMRGERYATKGLTTAWSGSSPHARGTLWFTSEWVARPRFIPACAGNASTHSKVTTSSPVHPRMRGERSQLGADGAQTHGSSPHARGTRQYIPPSVHPRSVHPRMRGERVLLHVGQQPAGGSSPHARGTPSRAGCP